MCQIKDVINSMKEASKYLNGKSRMGPLDISLLAFRLTMNTL